MDDIKKLNSILQTTPRRARSVTFDDIVRGLLQLPPAADDLNMDFQMARDEDDHINNNIVDDNDEEALIIVDEPLMSDDAGDGDEIMEDMDDFAFLERMMIYFGEADLIVEEEQQGSGDHISDAPLD
ncbi:hypothetical protein CDAR_457841 [Caerostris darwini]|uniref:Uncharacterized protein n=1 Tax=Caerostris darwini TaxID=1538125 RepID=A0AAV4V7T0_9ARAC|nr:hypothetical protein CDAR_457841 [Caerostris darwini]